MLNTMTPLDWKVIKDKLGLSEQITRSNKTGKSSPGPMSIPARSTGTIADMMSMQCRDGQRTEHLTTLAGKLLASGLSDELCLVLLHQWNDNNAEPLEGEKIERTFQSISGTDQRNHPERYERSLAKTPLFELSKGDISRYLTSKPLPRRWLIKDLIALGKAGSVVAPGGSSKSQWMMQLAVGVASGIPVADHWEVGEEGPVLVFFAEDDEDEIHRRLHRIIEQLKLEGYKDKLEGIESRLYMFSTIGTDTLLTKRGVTGEVQATTAVERILVMAQQVKDLKLIILDPASRFRGGEENSNEDATRFVEAIESLAKATGASVLFAHHASKASTLSDNEPGQGASRGASALTDGIRWQMNLTRPTEKQLSSVGASKTDARRFVVASVTKTNYSAIPEPVILMREDNGYLTASSPTSAQNLAETKAIQLVLQVLAQQSKPITARNLEERYGGINKRLKLPKHEVRRIVEVAKTRGLVEGDPRKPLNLTRLGLDMQPQFNATAEEANIPPENAPRKKI